MPLDTDVFARLLDREDALVAFEAHIESYFVEVNDLIRIDDAQNLRPLAQQVAERHNVLTIRELVALLWRSENNRQIWMALHEALVEVLANGIMMVVQGRHVVHDLVELRKVHLTTFERKAPHPVDELLLLVRIQQVVAMPERRSVHESVNGSGGHAGRRRDVILRLAVRSETFDSFDDFR